MNLLDYLRRRVAAGYRLLRSKEVRGAVIAPSELACHCRIVGKRVRFGIIGTYGYSYLVLEDGTLADGLFHIMNTPTEKLVALT